MKSHPNHFFLDLVMGKAQPRTDNAPMSRENFIHLRMTEIVDALLTAISPATVSPDAFHRFHRLAGHLLHASFYDHLCDLQESYFYFQPNHDFPPSIHGDTSTTAREKMLQKLHKVMEKGNFIVVSEAELRAEKHQQHGFFRLKIAPPIEQLAHFRFYRRGVEPTTETRPRCFGLWQQTHSRTVYSEVLLVAVTHDHEHFRYLNNRRWFRRIRPIFRPGAILLKSFRRVPQGELQMLFPNIRILLSAWDKLTIAIPAFFSAIPLIFKLLPTLLLMASTLAIVEIAYKVTDFQIWQNLLRGQIDQEIQFLIAGISVVVTPLAFMMGQILKVQHRFLRYRSQLIDNIYYRNISNNALVFDYLVNTAIEQELKEMVIAYFFLLAHGPQTLQKLDLRIEQWLLKIFGTRIDFEADDGLGKLIRFNLAEPLPNEQYRAKSLPDALTSLEAAWNQLILAKKPDS